MKALYLSFIILFASSNCSSPAQPDKIDVTPEWVNNLIAKFEREPVGNPLQSIWKYDYKGESVYYVPPQCCDQFSQLYDAKGNIIGAPSGGLSGGGDGRITDFFELRTNEKLIWRDERKVP